MCIVLFIENYCLKTSLIWGDVPHMLHATIHPDYIYGHYMAELHNI